MSYVLRSLLRYASHLSQEHIKHHPRLGGAKGKRVSLVHRICTMRVLLQGVPVIGLYHFGKPSWDQQKGEKETTTKKTRRGGRRHKRHKGYPLFTMGQNPAIASNVLNISKKILSDDEEKLLSKELNFCPTRHFDLFGTMLDVNKFARSLTLKKHYLDVPSNDDGNPLIASDTGESPPSP